MLFQSCILLQFFLFIASENPAMFQGVSRIKENVIAQFSESNSIFCELQCAVHRFCVAYNYKKKVDEKELNCQLTNTTEHKFDEDKVAKEEQEWTFYEINVDRSHFATCRKEVNECHNGGAMIWGPKKKFTCKCLKCYNGQFCENVHEMALGMENGSIRDKQITASGEWDTKHPVANGRLNLIPPPGQSGAWSSRYNNLSQWLQVDFQRSTLVTGISTQGRHSSVANQFVKSYTISFSKDGIYFQNYKNGKAIKEFRGNSDRNTIVHQMVVPHIFARFIRLHPTAWNNHISMRVEFYGCYVY